MHAKKVEMLLGFQNTLLVINKFSGDGYIAIIFLHNGIVMMNKLDRVNLTLPKDAPLHAWHDVSGLQHLPCEE